MHIAHVLYGGLLMLVALLLLFSLMNASVPWLAAFVGGVGFGLFIDEVGEFISSDVDYFYEPAVSVMYVVFMVLFLVPSGVRRWESRITPQDALANALSCCATVLRGEWPSRPVAGPSGCSGRPTPRTRWCVGAILLTGMSASAASCRRPSQVPPTLVKVLRS